MNLKQNLERLRSRYYQGFGLFLPSPHVPKDSKTQLVLNSVALHSLPPYLLSPTPASWVTLLNHILHFSCPQ